MCRLHRRDASVRILRVHCADVHAELRAPAHLRVRPRGKPRHHLRVRAPGRWARVRPLHAPLLPRDRHRGRGELTLPAHVHLVPRLRARLPDRRLVLLANRTRERLHV